MEWICVVTYWHGYRRLYFGSTRLDRHRYVGCHSPGLGNVGGIATYGASWMTDTDWIHKQFTSDTAEPMALYGISEVLTVPASVPEPSTVMLVGLGGLAALGYSFKRKRS